MSTFYNLVPHGVIKDVIKSSTVPQWIQQLLDSVMPELEDISDDLGPLYCTCRPRVDYFFKLKKKISLEF